MAKYHMRRIEKEISDEQEKLELLKNGKYAIISMCKDNEPYVVTLCYGYDDTKNSLYFHCAKEGQKIDFIKANPFVCGTVIEEKGYQKGCGQAFRSVIFRGKMVIIEELQEKKYGFDVLIDHLEEKPDEVKKKFFKKEETYEKSGMIRLDINEITGKEEKAEG
ncbi:MAG: pyridoxamine 5'-phosphate oxidase family protein [Candidatus Heimdallarchaeota archaeon]